MAAREVAPVVRGQGGTSLALRVLSGVVAVPLLLGVSYLGGSVYGLAVAGATVLGAWEARRLLRASGHMTVDSLLLGVSALLPLDAWFFGQEGQTGWVVAPHGMLILAAAAIASLSGLLLRRRLEGALVVWALSLALAVYLGGLMQFFAPLRQRADGAFWVMLLLGLSWSCDTAAYFVGRAFGRVPLAPAVSPKKSVEGAAAGLAAATAVAVVVGLASGKPLPLLAGYGAVIGAATILGDLAESLLKRQVGAKDSGVLVPGHGGVLDRMDSLLFCAPVAVVYLLLLA